MEHQINFEGATHTERLTVVVDAGHGGRDPGAVGRDLGLFEKDVVLNIALELERLAVKRGGFNIVLPRRTDVRLSIAQRNAPAGDIFLSLHCNAFGDRMVHGHETFYLKGVNYSHDLAECVVRSVVTGTGWRNRGARPNNTFGVLRGNRHRPAVLVEYDFISNALRERELADKLTQYKLAELTYNGIMEFINEGW